MGTTMSIGEFARRVGLAVSAVRFYADRGLLVPADIDASSGYRLYDESQVAAGVLIRDLRRMDMPLADIAGLLELSEPSRRDVVEAHLVRLGERLHRAHTIAESLGAPLREKESTMSARALSALPALSLPAVDLAHALDQVLPAASADPTRPHLMCILVEVKEDSVRLVATDSHRVAVRDLVPTATGGEFSAVVAAATVSAWRDMLRAAGGQVTLTLKNGELHVVSASASSALHECAPLLPTEFPDYERILTPRDGLTKVVVDREALLASLESFDDELGAVLLSAGGERLRLERRSESANLLATCEGGEAHVAVNPAFAADAVRNAVGAEVILEIDDPLLPVIFRSADDGTYTSLLMGVELEPTQAA